MLEARHKEQRLKARVRYVPPIDYSARPPGTRDPVEVAGEVYLENVRLVRTNRLFSPVKKPRNRMTCP